MECVCFHVIVLLVKKWNVDKNANQNAINRNENEPNPEVGPVLFKYAFRNWLIIKYKWNNASHVEVLERKHPMPISLQQKVGGVSNYIEP